MTLTLGGNGQSENAWRSGTPRSASRRAARIAAQASGGEILASEAVRQVVAGKGFLFADRGETALRGFEDPLRLYEVRWQEG